MNAKDETDRDTTNAPTMFVHRLKMFYYLVVNSEGYLDKVNSYIQIQNCNYVYLPSIS